MSTIEKAIQIAVKAHAGQKQRNGDPYILHPLRLMMQLTDPDEQMAAILHDVIEDSDWTISRLSSEGFSEKVLKIVDLLTHYEKDSYTNYIKKIKKHPVATKLKLLDLQDNMNISRLPILKDNDLERLKRYHIHWKMLKENNDAP